MTTKTITKALEKENLELKNLKMYDYSHTYF